MDLEKQHLLKINDWVCAPNFLFGCAREVNWILLSVSSVTAPYSSSSGIS